MMTDKSEKSLLYFDDPMCSWCWGFAPVIHQIRLHYADLPIQMFMGGLNPGNTSVMDHALKQDLRHHWTEAHAASGQAFNEDFFHRENFVYDTEPPSQAVIAAFRIDSAQALAFLTHLQSAFYTANRDITQRSELIALATEFGLDAELFKTRLDDRETVRITRLSFQYTRHLKISGFPTLIGQGNGAHTIITRGYQKLEKINNHIQLWLESID